MVANFFLGDARHVARVPWGVATGVATGAKVRSAPSRTVTEPAKNRDKW